MVLGPWVLKKLIEEKKLDYAALDLKTSFERYAEFSLEKDSVQNEKRVFFFAKTKCGPHWVSYTTLDPRVVIHEDLENSPKQMKLGSRWYWQQFNNEKIVLAPLMRLFLTL